MYKYELKWNESVRELSGRYKIDKIGRYACAKGVPQNVAFNKWGIHIKRTDTIEDVVKMGFVTRGLKQRDMFMPIPFQHLNQTKIQPKGICNLLYSTLELSRRCKRLEDGALKQESYTVYALQKFPLQHVSFLMLWYWPLW